MNGTELTGTATRNGTCAAATVTYCRSHRIARLRDGGEFAWLFFGCFFDCSTLASHTVLYIYCTCLCCFYAASRKVIKSNVPPTTSPLLLTVSSPLVSLTNLSHLPRPLMLIINPVNLAYVILLPVSSASFQVPLSFYDLPKCYVSRTPHFPFP